MSKTPFSDKCVVLGGLWLYYRDDAKNNEDWTAFFNYNDIGLPLAYMIADNIVTPSKDSDAEEIIEETWNMLCEFVEVDPNGEYDSILDVWAASPNTPIVKDE